MENEKNLDCLKLAYYGELILVIGVIGQYVKSSVTVDENLLSTDFYDEFGGHYVLTIHAEDDFSLYSVFLHFDGRPRFCSSFANISFIKKVVNMLLEWYVESED